MIMSHCPDGEACNKPLFTLFSNKRLLNTNVNPRSNFNSDPGKTGTLLRLQITHFLVQNT